MASAKFNQCAYGQESPELDRVEKDPASLDAVRRNLEQANRLKRGHGPAPREVKNHEKRVVESVERNIYILTIALENSLGISSCQEL